MKSLVFTVLSLGCGAVMAQPAAFTAHYVTDNVFQIDGTDRYVLTRSCDVRPESRLVKAERVKNGKALRFETGSTCPIAKELVRTTPPVGRLASKISHNYDGVFTVWKKRLYAISTTQTLLTMMADGALIVDADKSVRIDFDGTIIPVSLVLTEAP